MNRDKFFYIGFTLLSAVLIISAVLIVGISEREQSITAGGEADEPCIIIDAGHGGEDGGCVSERGVLEKELNLNIAYKIEAFLKLAGYNAIMTRTEDKMLYDMYPEVEYTGRKKVYDLKNRLRFANENNADMLVSVHMNKFPIEKYKGLQVYYSGNNAESERIASTVREYNSDYLQTDNEREIKKAGKNIYLLDRTEIPAVLIECGFLSNPEECDALCNEEYQKELSFVIASALIKSIVG